MNAVKKKLDSLLGRFTMYRLVVVLLALLSVEALVLAIAGLIAPSVLEVLASLAVALGATTIATFVIALIYRVRPHLESAIITGYLIFFILPPSLEGSSLLAIAIAGLIASASKFVLAVRGRHIFNPAAIGALAVTITGLSFSGWWVSTVYFLPLVAIGAFLILYRTHRLALGLVFITVVAVVDVAVFALTGFPVAEALAFAFTGTATVFFAGFMLSEPLTLPPRRWQQLVVAALVGALFAIPFSIGPLFSTPELALVIGNVLAFALSRRRGVALELAEKKQLTPTTWQFSFSPLRPVSFEPGQYLELSLPHAKADVRGQRRTFSISSAPSAGAPLTIGVKMSDRSSSFKTTMLDLQPGARVHATTVAGDFVLPKDAATPLLFVAGGIGITPFASQLAHVRDSGVERDIVVIFSASSGDELAYRDEIASSGARVIVIAPSEPTELPLGWEYAGAERLSSELLSQLVPDVSKRHAFVSGPPALVDDAKKILKRARAKRVTTDYFTGY